MGVDLHVLEAFEVRVFEVLHNVLVSLFDRVDEPVDKGHADHVLVYLRVPLEGAAEQLGHLVVVLAVRVVVHLVLQAHVVRDHLLVEECYGSLYVFFEDEGANVVDADEEGLVLAEITEFSVDGLDEVGKGEGVGGMQEVLFGPRNGEEVLIDLFPE